MADRLELYNDALMLCAERFLASLAEEREPRRLLDQAWNANGGAIKYCLEQGQWWFAMRTQRIDPDPAIAPPFGYPNAYPKPADWIRTCAVCSDERFNVPITGYADEVGYWFSDVNPIYVKFTSSDANYGGDLGQWPATFAAYVSAYLASRIMAKLGGDKTDQIRFLFGPPAEEAWLQHSLNVALSKAALTQPTAFMPVSSWIRSRRGRRAGSNDRGNTGSLIG